MFSISDMGGGGHGVASAVETAVGPVAASPAAVVASAAAAATTAAS